MGISKRNRTLVNQHGQYKVEQFKDLPVECQDALIHYMSVDGAAWAVYDAWPEWKWGEGTPYAPKLRRQMLKDIGIFRSKFVEEYGHINFGFGQIPTEQLLAAIRKDEDPQLVDSTDYRPAKMRGFDHYWEYDLPTWPVILSGFEHETIQDGWTRFSRYCQLGRDWIPCVWFVN